MLLRRGGYWLLYAGIACFLVSQAAKYGGLPALVGPAWMLTPIIGGAGLVLLALYYAGRLFKITPAVRR